MQTRIEEKTEMTIVGIVSTGYDVREISVDELWGEFDQLKMHIMHRVPAKHYEVHIDDLAINKHFCIVGTQVERIERLPLQMFVKIIPAGRYAIFTHEFKNGGLTKAYKLMSDWMMQNDSIQAFPLEIQCYDERFLGFENPNSVLEFHIPIKTKK